MSERNEKLKFLGRLQDLENGGVFLTKKFTMDDSLEEIKNEYRMKKEEMKNSEDIFALFYIGFLAFVLASYR
jgi:hypothetical protein